MVKSRELGVGQALHELTDWVLHQDRRWVIIIDGRSGAGKTTFAGELERSLASECAMRRGAFYRCPRVVHLDEFYPGWVGLAQARDMVAELVLAPQNPGYRCWNWQTNQPGNWVTLHPRQPLIIEGVGALSEGAIGVLKNNGIPHRTVTIEAPMVIRELRALTRDPDFAPWWDMWSAQEDEHLKLRPTADLQVDSTRP